MNKELMPWHASFGCRKARMISLWFVGVAGRSYRLNAGS